MHCTSSTISKLYGRIYSNHECFQCRTRSCFKIRGKSFCFVSRTLNGAEKNYLNSEKELLSIVWATQRLRQYLLERTFNIQTDHQALKWLHNMKNPSSRLLRWRLRLEESNYNPIECIKGKENKVTDCLSRLCPMREKI